VHLEQTRDNELAKKKRIEEIRAGLPPSNKERTATPDAGMLEVMMYLVIAFTLIFAICGGVIWAILKFVGEEPSTSFLKGQQ
jgi:hypothetical protein